MLVAATVTRHRRGGPLLIILVLLLIGGAIWLVVHQRDKRRQLEAEHRASREPAPPPAGAPAPPPPPPPGVASDGAPATPRTFATDGAPAAAFGEVPIPPPMAPGSPAPAPAFPPPSAASGDWAVETHALTKRFGTNVAVDNVELLVPRGSAFGYLGPNGAGKTTLIRTLLGLTHADSGTMSLLGVPVPSERSRALSRVGAIVDEPRFHRHLSGEQNLLLLAAARGPGAKVRIEPSLQRVGLTERANDKVAAYSMGMRQRLGVAACLLDDPELLILDEPMNGLDPAGMQEMRTMVDTLVHEGRTVMLSSHLLDEVERTCNAVAIVDRGRVIRQGSISDLVRTANMIVRIGCSDPQAAARVISDAALSVGISTGDAGLTATLTTGATQETVAEIVRLLVAQQISVYRIEEVRTSLEDWFLSVTSRLGDPQ